MNKPKVLYFMLRPDEKDQITGGAWSALHILSHVEKYEPFIVTTERDLLTDKIESMGIPYTIVEEDYLQRDFRKRSLVGKVMTILRILYYNYRLWRVIKRVNPAMVQTDEMGAMMVFLSAKLAGKKLVIYVRNAFRGERLKWVYRIPMIFSDSIVAISNELSRYLAREGGRIIGKKVVQIYNSVDFQRIDEVKKEKTKQLCRAELGIHADIIAIGIVAAVTAVKRQEEFLRHVAERFNHDDQIFFYFIGGTKEKLYHERCSQVINKLNLTRAIFVGFQPNVYMWYQALDIVCLPSGREGVPRAVIEASAFDLPVVAFNIPGCREAVINGETGFLVDTFDEFAQRLNTLINTPELREHMGSRGCEHARKTFNVTENTRQLESLYDSLLK